MVQAFINESAEIAPGALRYSSTFRIAAMPKRHGAKLMVIDILTVVFFHIG